MRICVITGGTGGIGLHLCEGFQRAGYAVTALDVEQHKALPDGIGFIQTDLRQAEAVSEAFRRVTERHGAVHVLVNNAALAHFHKPVMEMTADEFDNALSVNLRGAFLCAQAFIKANAGQDYGRIINIASTRYQQNECGWEAYGASKGGLVSLTASLCVSLHGTGITVNAVSPGWIQVDDYDSLTSCDHSQHPSGRVGKPEDVCNACLFLAGEENGFINGVNLPVDGGMTRRMIYPEADPLWTE